MEGTVLSTMGKIMSMFPCPSLQSQGLLRSSSSVAIRRDSLKPTHLSSWPAFLDGLCISPSPLGLWINTACFTEWNTCHSFSWKYFWVISVALFQVCSPAFLASDIRGGSEERFSVKMSVMWGWKMQSCIAFMYIFHIHFRHIRRGNYSFFLSKNRKEFKFALWILWLPIISMLLSEDLRFTYNHISTSISKS